MHRWFLLGLAVANCDLWGKRRGGLGGGGGVRQSRVGNMCTTILGSMGTNKQIAMLMTGALGIRAGCSTSKISLPATDYRL